MALKKADLVIAEIRHFLEVFDIYVNGRFSFRNRLFFNVEMDRPIRGDISPRFRGILSTNSQDSQVSWRRCPIFVEIYLHVVKESSPQAICERSGVMATGHFHSDLYWKVVMFDALMRQGPEKQRL